MSEPEITELIETFSNEFDAMCTERHNDGAERYGPFKFLGADVIQEAIEEIVDMANYSRYQFIKLRLLQLAMQKAFKEDPKLKGLADENGDITIGTESFHGTGDMQ